MHSSTFRARSRAIAGALGAVVLVGGLATAAQAAPLPEAVSAPLGVCTPDGGFPAIDGSTPAQPQVHDTGVNTYAGGDFIVAGNAAEAEGLVVVNGDAVIGKDFVVGIAIGSDVRPAPGESMLQVGGDVDVAPGSTLHVGDVAMPGGAVAVGGTATTGGISNAGADLRTGIGAADALDPYADFSAQISTWSSSLAALDANGAVSVSSGWVVLELTGTGDDEMQVFDVTAEQLSSADEIRFTGIDPYAPVLVNVIGGPVAVTASTYFYNGAALTMTSANDGNIAASILWNYEDAAAVEIGGTGQVPGSILAPAADVDVIANANGRVYVGGDLTTRGQGNELHSYPWAGTCVDDGDGDASADADGSGADADGSGADADGSGADADGSGADAGGSGADAGGSGADADGSGADADGSGADADGAGADADGADADGGDADAGAAGDSDAGAADSGSGNADAATADSGTGASAEAAASGTTDVVTDATASEESGDALATTGGTVSVVALVMAAALLAAGGVLAVRRRRA